MAVELVHEALAEAHDLAVGLALRVEVGAALAAAHGQGRQAVLQGLLKAEEFYNRGSDGGVEAQAAPSIQWYSSAKQPPGQRRTGTRSSFHRQAAQSIEWAGCTMLLHLLGKRI